MSDKVDTQLIKTSSTGDNLLQLCKIEVREDYRKKWNIHENDFLLLVKNGEVVRDTLYRKGGMSNFTLNKDKYFMLLKNVEAHYSEEILKMCGTKDSKHLKSVWCILNQNGDELIDFENSLNYPYLVKDTPIYSINSSYFNAETGECYCKYSSHRLETDEFLFLDTTYDEDKSKRGVLKVSKIDGTSELFKQKMCNEL